LLLTTIYNNASLIVHSFQPHRTPTRITTATALNGKLWNKLEIEEDSLDDPPAWYLMNCIVGSELDLLDTAQHATENMSSEQVDKITVPVERHLRSHGKRNVVDVKVRYPGYVFVKMRLTVETYEALQQLELCRSWMSGTINKKGYKKLPPAPFPLSTEEASKFKGLEDDMEEMWKKFGNDYTGKGDFGEDLEGQYKGYKVGDMVKILEGTFQGEDGVVKRLKDGKLFIRMYTYGSVLDHWHKPKEVRKMTDEEAMIGLTGPDGPIGQDDFDVSIGKKPKDFLDGNSRGGGRSLRSNLMSNVRGAGAGAGVGAGYGSSRNRRQDRMSRGQTGRSLDAFGRTKQEAKDEESNWKKFRESQRSRQQEEQKKNRQGGESSWGMKEASSWDGKERDYDPIKDSDTYIDEDFLLRQREIPESPQAKKEDDFFDDLMAELANDLDSGSASTSSTKQTPPTPVPSASAADTNSGDEDDFFNSLMSDLSESMNENENSQEKKTNTNRGGSNDNVVKAPSTFSNDDFFANLEAELSDSLEGSATTINSGSSSNLFDNIYTPSPPPSTTSTPNKDDSVDDFFATLESDLKSNKKDSNSDNDFFATLENELTDLLTEDPPPTKGTSSFMNEIESEINERKDEESDDDFFSNLEDELSDLLDNSATTGVDMNENETKDTQSSNEQNNVSASTTTNNKSTSLQQSRNIVEEEASLVRENDNVEEEDDFFSNLENELNDLLMDNTSPAENLATTKNDNMREIGVKTTQSTDKQNYNDSSPVQSIEEKSSQNLSKMTVNTLKEILREKGLKVSGKKSELIERLQQASG